MVNPRFEMEYVVECCEARYGLLRRGEVRPPFSVNAYVDPNTGTTVACKYGYCKECDEHRPKTNLRMRIES